MGTYVTGPESASKAILIIYDIFGFFPQTIQGADILANSNEQKYRVFMPDFFEGQPADITWFPPQTDEHKQKLGNFFQTKAAPPNTLSKIPNFWPRPTSSLPAAALTGPSWATAGAVRSLLCLPARTTSSSSLLCSAPPPWSTPTTPRP